jgi:hypothetical protein
MRGEVVYYYAFDVANEIATQNIGAIGSGETIPFELRTDHTVPKDVPLYRPLTFVLTRRKPRCGGCDVRVIIRVYEVGVINVVMRVPFDAPELASLHPLHQPRLESGETFDEFARDLCREVIESLAAAIIRGSEPTQPEAYTVFCVTELDGNRDVNTWFSLHRRPVAGLLTETPPERLSDSQVEESLRVCRSFSDSDLVVMDWDSSLVVELDGYAEDVLYVLELANLQLEEFRVMDRRLDSHLERAYRDLEQRWSAIFGAPTSMLKWLRRFRVDATKLADEVSHITKFFGDWHMARVYLGAAERFHLAQWQQSIEKRLSQLDQLYQLIQADIYERRMLWLEVAIVVLFVIDLLALFFWKGS